MTFEGLACRAACRRSCARRCLLFVSPAQAGKRVALVIGNNAYENVPQLQKAVNDAEAIAEELAKLGFEVVPAENVGRRAMSRALVDLENKVQAGDTVLFYFAGHGFAVDGTNYLLPVDVPAAGPGEEGLVRDAAFAATGLSDQFQAKGAATVILILDACRDNPFALKAKRSIGLTRGLARMDPAEGMFVLFSAGQGQSALDRLSDTDANPNSVFTRTLLAEMAQPGLSMVQIAKETQSKVRELAAKVDHEQTPAYYDQIIGDLYLAPEGAVAAKGAVAPLTGRRRGRACCRRRSRRVAALPTSPQPLASFTRSNAVGWSMCRCPRPPPNSATASARRGASPMPALTRRARPAHRRAHAEDQLRDAAGPGQDHDLRHLARQARRAGGRRSHQFRSMAALADEQKKILDQFWTSWIAFREWQGMMVYFSQLITYRCAIREVRYGFGDGPVDKVFKLPPCDPSDPNGMPENATLYMKVPPKTASMQVQLTYVDGTQSPTRTFNAPK